MGNIFINYSYALPGRSAIKLIFDSSKSLKELGFDESLYSRIIASDANKYQSDLSRDILNNYILEVTNLMFLRSDIISSLKVKEKLIDKAVSFVIERSKNSILEHLDTNNLIVPTSNSDIDVLIKAQPDLKYWDTCCRFFTKPDTKPLWHKAELNKCLKECDIDEKYFMDTHVMGASYVWNTLSPDGREYMCKPDSGSGGKGNFAVVRNDVRVLQLLQNIDYEYEIDFKYNPDRNWDFFVVRRNDVMSGGYATSFTLDTLHENPEAKEVVALTKHIMDGCGYTGIGSLSFLKTKEGNLKVLEFNPRLTGSTASMLYMGENILAFDKPRDPKIIRIGCNIQDYFVMGM